MLSGPEKSVGAVAAHKDLHVSPVEQFYHEAVRAIPTLVLAFVGGIVQMLNAPEEITVRRFFAGATTAVFAGTLMYLALDFTDLSMAVKGAIVGLTGYGSGQVLPMALRAFCLYLGNWAKQGGKNAD